MPKSLSNFYCSNKNTVSFNSLPVLNVYVQVNEKHFILFLEDERPFFFQKNVTKIQKLCKISTVQKKMTVS